MYLAPQLIIPLYSVEVQSTPALEILTPPAITINTKKAEDEVRIHPERRVLVVPMRKYNKYIVLIS